MKITNDLKEDLQFFFKTKNNLIIQWEAWIGKTSIIEAFWKENNMPVIKVLASSLDETDIAWIIVHDKKTNSAKTISPFLYKQIQKPCIVFFDELNTARKEVQDTLLTLIQSRVFPNWDTIHKDVWFIAAQNSAIDYNNYEMSPAMKNRFAWLEYIPSIESFCSYLENREDKKKNLYDIFIEWFKKEKIKFSDTKNQDIYTYTTPRSICNLIDSVSSFKELLQFSPAFVDDSLVLYLKTLIIKENQNEANEIFWFKWYKRNKSVFIK